MIVPILSYDLNNVFANFRRSFVGVAATKNQRAVARQLESIVDPDPAEDVLLTAITNLSVTEAQKVLDELSAQQYTNFLMTSELANRQFIRRVFNALRPSLVYDPCACTCDYLGKYYVWVEGGYGMDQYKKKGTIRGFKNKHYDITCGVQARPLDFFTLGTALSYEHAQMHYNLSASGRSHNFFGGIYSLYRPECFYILGELAVGYSDEKIRRRVNVGPVLSYRPHSKPKVIQSGLYLEAGKDYNFFCTHIQPFVGFEFGYHYLHQFHEHGAYPINLSVCAHTQDNADGRFGLHITPENCWNVLMSLDVAWEYRFTKFKNKIRERFLAFGNSFPIFGSYWTRNSIEAAFSFYVPFCECWEVFAEANGEWWQRLNTYNVMGGIGVKW